jgi:hypothetical protein
MRKIAAILFALICLTIRALCADVDYEQVSGNGLCLPADG